MNHLKTPVGLCCRLRCWQCLEAAQRSAERESTCTKAFAACCARQVRLRKAAAVFPPMSGGWVAIPHSIGRSTGPAGAVAVPRRCQGWLPFRGGTLRNKGRVRCLGSSSEKSLPILRMKCSKSGRFFVSNSWPRGILIVLRVELCLAFVLPASLLVQLTQPCAEKYPAFG